MSFHDHGVAVCLDFVAIITHYSGMLNAALSYILDCNSFLGEIQAHSFTPWNFSYHLYADLTYRKEVPGCWSKGLID